MRLQSHKKRLLRQRVIEMLVVRVNYYRGLGEFGVQKARAADVIEMSVRQRYRL